MAVASVTLSSWILPERAPLRRAPPRPFALRQAEYSDTFDSRTLIYDLFRRPDGAGAVAIAPPPCNLLYLIACARIATGRGTETRSLSILERDRMTELWFRAGPADGEVTFGDSPLGRVTLPIQPNGSDEFADRRVLFTISRNNEIAWISDWARFHRRAHGADAILFYDNASDRYDSAEIGAALRQAAPGAQIRVVDWPFPFGPQGSADGKVWDSDFCQYGMFHHARWRFLARAKSVLNIDIDEMVLSARRESIFAAAESSREGYVAFGGHWIAYTPPEAKQRVADLRMRDLSKPTAATKWCAVPARCGLEQQWRVHDITGFSHSPVPAEQFSHRHFWAISTSWKHNRSRPAPFDPAIHVVDDVLAAQIAEHLA